MSATDLKSDLHRLVVETNDVKILRRVIAYFTALREGKVIEWAITDEDLTKMSMQLSATTLAEVWDNEEDEIWNTL